MLIRFSSRTAICRGAIFKGFVDQFATGDMFVTSTISRASFGVKCCRIPWNETHDPKDKKWQKYEGCYGAENQMEWYIKKVCKLRNTIKHANFV